MGIVLLNTIFLTLPQDGEQALIARVETDYCGESHCKEIRMYNLARENSDIWCVNLSVNSSLYINSPLSTSYMMRHQKNGSWEMEEIPGSICNTYSLPDRKYILK